MSKSKYAIARKDAPAKTLNAVKAVIEKADKNRYSVSAIYAAHNEVMGLRETPQGCTSCLVSRVSTLRAWLGSDKQVDTQALRNAVLNATHNPQTGNAFISEAAKTAASQDTGLSGDQLKEYIENAAKELGLSEDSTREEFIAGLSLLSEGEHPEEVKAQLQALIEKLQSEDPANDPNAPQYAAPAEGVTRYPMGDDAVPFDFTPSADDALKGTIKAADGTNVKAGTYTAADGTVIAVSVGNKATIKDDVL